MFSRIRRRMTYANIAMTLALVFAMSGGAYAAGKYLITSTKQIKPSVLASLKGAKGANGAQGPAGPAGPAGPEGKVGAPGAPGKEGAGGANGSDGQNGAAGESVKSAVVPQGNKSCAEGGSKFTVGGKETFACNGKEGPVGPTGPQGPLQPGKTESGQWAVAQFVAGETSLERVAVGLSFPIPLASPLDSEHVHYMPRGVEPAAGTGDLTSGSAEVTNVTTTSSGKFAVGSTISGAGIPAGSTITAIGESTPTLTLSKAAETSGTGVSLTAGPPAGCGGSVAKPEAASGNLCVFTNIAADYASGLLNLEFGIENVEVGGGGAGTAGAVMFSPTSVTYAKGTVFADGDWVVTG
jgi:hypothetical protein